MQNALFSTVYVKAQLLVTIRSVRMPILRNCDKVVMCPFARIVAPRHFFSIQKQALGEALSTQALWLPHFKHFKHAQTVPQTFKFWPFIATDIAQCRSTLILIKTLQAAEIATSVAMTMLVWSIAWRPWQLEWLHELWKLWKTRSAMTLVWSCSGQDGILLANVLMAADVPCLRAPQQAAFDTFFSSNSAGSGGFSNILFLGNPWQYLIISQF